MVEQHHLRHTSIIVRDSVSAHVIMCVHAYVASSPTLLSRHTVDLVDQSDPSQIARQVPLLTDPHPYG